MKQLVLLFFCAFLSFGNAQNTVSSDESFDGLIKLCTTFLYKDASKALEYAIEAKGQALVNGNNEQLTRAFYYISKCQNKLNTNRVALKSINSAITEAISLKDLLFLYKCFCLKGDILSTLGEDSKALMAYLKATKYAKDLGDSASEIVPLLNIAFIKKKHKDFEEAISINKDILKSLNTIDNSRDKEEYRLVSFMNIAEGYLLLKNPDEAEFYNKEGLKKCSDKIKSWYYYIFLMNKGTIHYQRAEYNESVLIAKQVRDYALKVKDRTLYLTSLVHLGKNSNKLMNYKKSIYYLEKALDTINISDNVDPNKKVIHEFLADAYQENENYEKASFHNQKYRALEKKESTEDLKINNEIHELVDIKPLKTEIDQLGEKLVQQSRNKKTLIMLTIGSLILLMGSLLYYRKKGKFTRKKVDELLKKVAELENTEEKQIAPKKDNVSDKKARTILNKIANFEKKEYYLSTECSLGFMAEKLETNTTYLSKVINTYKGKSYTAYITELRMNTALVRLKNDKTLQSYTIKAIAEEFGYNRQETFSRAFKAYTGIYPSQYLKNL